MAHLGRLGQGVVTDFDERIGWEEKHGLRGDRLGQILGPLGRADFLLQGLGRR